MSMEDIPTDDDFRNQSAWKEFIEKIIDECESEFAYSNGDGQHRKEMLAREVVEDHVFQRGLARAAFIAANCQYDLGEWEPFVGQGTDPLTGRFEAMAYSKLIQEVFHDLRDRGHDV